MRFAVLGLGEAGSLFASDLVTAGQPCGRTTRQTVPTPDGVVRPDVAGTVAEAEVVLVITGAADATRCRGDRRGGDAGGALVADLSTSAPVAKAARDAVAGRRPWAPVRRRRPDDRRARAGHAHGRPGVSGSGPERYAAAMGPLGVPVVAIGERAGDASTRKLLRSVTMKGTRRDRDRGVRGGGAGRARRVALGRPRRRVGGSRRPSAGTAVAWHGCPRRSPHPRDGGDRRCSPRWVSTR